MIREIRQALINKLLELYPDGYTCYLDSVPQNFNTPSFLLTVNQQDYRKRLAGTYQSTVSLELAYFSAADEAGIKSDCLTMQETLLRNLDFVGSFRILNKRAKVTDNVLHLTFDVKYSERQIKSDTLMESIKTTTKMKE